MLAVALPPDLGPGENLKGQVSGATWRYLLPRLKVDTVLFLGRPAELTLQTLERISERVVVLEAVEGPLPVDAASVDLLVISESRLHGRDPGRTVPEAELRRVLTADGACFVLLPRPPRSSTAGGAQQPEGLFRTAERLWTLSRGGELRAAAPADSTAAIRFIQRSLLSPAPRGSLAKRAGRWLRGRAGNEGWREGSAILWRGNQGFVSQPPRYLADAARAAGLSIDGYDWAFVDSNDYPTRKILVFLFPADHDQPAYVAKIAREPRFNQRIQNAWHALKRLQDPALPGRAQPRPVFQGEADGLAFMAETMLEGGRLKDKLADPAAGDHIRAAAEWLVELGLASADERADSAEVAAALNDLLARFRNVYQPSAAQMDFLARQFRTLGEARVSVPLVMQHGDPGTWNILVDGQGRPAFLDWESAWRTGAPLWDLFYFLRSAAVGMASRRVFADPLGAFEQQFFEPGQVARLQVELVDRFCTEAELERRVVEPLFYACWMYRSLKQASTLPVPRLATSHYLRLLERCIKGRHSPGLRLLFGDVTRQMRQ